LSLSIIYVANIEFYVTNIEFYVTNIGLYVDNIEFYVTNIGLYVANIEFYVTNIEFYVTNIFPYPAMIFKGIISLVQCRGVLPEDYLLCPACVAPYYQYAFGRGDGADGSGGGVCFFCNIAFTN
jgi:hypothetical protein